MRSTVNRSSRLGKPSNNIVDMHMRREREREKVLLSASLGSSPRINQHPQLETCFPRSRFPQLIHGLKYLHAFGYERFGCSPLLSRSFKNIPADSSCSLIFSATRTYFVRTHIQISNVIIIFVYLEYYIQGVREKKTSRRESLRF